MHETPNNFNDASGQGDRLYPADDLASFRWHTGATLRSLAPDEPCPALFRDIGPAALAEFLRGGLRRLAGPMSPLVYMRIEGYLEPYVDYECTGRLVILRPLTLHAWHSGVPHIYVARAKPGVDAGTVGFVPGTMPLTQAALLARDVADTGQWREALGGRIYDEAAAESLAALDRLAVELAESERWAAPLRRCLQAADRSLRDLARTEMGRVALTEADLCVPWHHLPRERRGWIEDNLQRIDPRLTT